ncbi:FecR domain-containing protein [Mucilaginibacter sp. BJC16-A38]|uniref:FecR family protein n=1 Tax=Mucilaginibacter phenanthrenivorans TaxID=1234842 RepID=UPI002157F155|nr:FecR family protein [Mucilaginibacter phenanthrenivorans]MCR8558685.1 FecR domain-containing protein [Mucilaginibacter phenanthrenivorans]
MNEQEIKKLLKKFHSGKCTPEELALLKAMMHEFDSETDSKPLKEGLKQALWERIEMQTVAPAKVRQLNMIWLKVAAALVLAILGGILYSGKFFNHNAGDRMVYQTVTAPKGQMTQVTLPDNTVVQLNAGTTIKFPVKFSDKKREVFLLDGEAFFEVEHDALKPFLVHTAKVTTQVLGTSFNIKFYNELSDIRLFVKTGKVEVHDQTHTFGMYTPRQLLIYNKQSQSFIKQQIADDHSISWMSDELILDNVSFKEVAVYLQNRYNINFRYLGTKPNRQHYSVRLPNKLTIKQVVDILQVIDGRSYKLQGNTVNIK